MAEEPNIRRTDDLALEVTQEDALRVLAEDPSASEALLARIRDVLSSATDMIEGHGLAEREITLTVYADAQELSEPV